MDDLAFVRRFRCFLLLVAVPVMMKKGSNHLKSLLRCFVLSVKSKLYGYGRYDLPFYYYSQRLL